MKLYLTLAAALLAAACLMSCANDGAESESGNAEETSASEVSAPEDAAIARLARLELDNGNKWVMDDHTRTIFAEMAATFQDSDPSSLDDEGRRDVGTSLQAQLKELIRGCTMTGTAHDQLHVFLAGYIPAISALAESGQVEDARTLKRYLDGYGEYFE